MTPKKIALVLAPIAAFALGWTVRTVFAPPAEEAVTVADEEEPTEEGSAAPAGRQGAGAGKKAKGGKQKAGAGGDEKAIAKGGELPFIPIARLEVRLWAGRDVPAPEGTYIRLRPTVVDDQNLPMLRRWARGQEAGSGLVELLSDEGALVAADGAAKYDEVPAIAMTLEVWHEADEFAAGSQDLGKLKEKRTKLVQINVTTIGDSEARAAAKPDKAAPERKRDPAELVPFHALVLTAADEPMPVAGAKVQDRGRTIATTDEEGRFELPYDASLAPTVRVVGDGVGPAIVQVGPGHAAADEALVVRLRPSGSMEVRLLSADGRPVPGVQVRLSTDMIHIVGEESGFHPDEFEMPTELGEITWSATTNNFGVAFLEGLPVDAPLSIRAQRQGGKANSPPLSGIPTRVTLAPGEKWTDEWRLPSRPVLRGRVVDHENEPVVGAPMWLVPSNEGALTGARYLAREDQPAATAVSGADGSFTFEDVAPGVWLVGVGLPGAGEKMAWQLELDHLARPVQVPELGGPELGEVLLRVGRGLTMRGVVLDPNGRAAAGVLVTALEDSGRGVAEARTDADGQFVLGPLSKASFRLIVAGSEGSSIQHYGPMSAGSRDLVLKLARSTPLTGRVVSPSGDPRAATVAVFQGGVLRAQVRTLEPEQPGVFSASGLEPGHYDFVAVTADGQIGQVEEIEIGHGKPEGAVRIPLATAGLLTLRHQGARAWTPFELLKDGKPIALGILHRGVPRALFAPAGTLTVRMESGDDKVFERSIDLQAGGAAELVLEAEPAAGVSSDGSN